jgi:hypothetical protein
MKFLSQINVNTRYTLPMVDGTNGQVLSTDGNGVAYWGTISIGSLPLDGLSDVIITSPSSDQMLRYGLRQGDTVPVWHNFTPNFLTPSSSINALNDVVITTAAVGQILQYNGSAWVNATLSTVEYVSKVQHTVKAGVAIAKGQAVYVTSSNGTNMIVGLASNASESTSSKTMGLAASTAAINDNIFVVTEGLLAGLDTSTATAGDPVWLGTSGNLIFGLLNKPVAPAHLVFIGIVTRVQQNNGEIFVKVQNGFELNEIHDVLISSPATGQLIRRESDGLWKNWTPNFLTSLPAHNHNDIYYTESEIDSLFAGETEIDGYNRGAWDIAYNDKINSASFSTTTGVLTLNQQDTGTVTVDLDGRYLESYTETDPTVPSHVKSITATNISNWNDAVNDSIRSASFNTSNGVLTLTQVDLGTVTVDLDGRYITSETDSQTLTWTKATSSIAISNGNSVTLEGLATETFVQSQGYITGISFANVSAKPTTIAGYGITDAITTTNIGNQSVAFATVSRRVIDTPSARITTPEGAYSVGNSSGTGGAIKISLPTTVYNNNTMMSMTVEVYLYSTGQSFTLRIGGYNYYDGTWYNVFASILSDSGKSTNVPVYFGNNGVDRNVIWIGDSNSTWEYPNVFVTDFQSGHSQNEAWAKGWSVSFSESEQTNVTASRIAYRQVDAGNIGSYALTSLPAHNHDDRYYTETESDTRYVNTSGDTMSGNLTLSGYTNPHITLTTTGGDYSYLALYDGSTYGYIIKNVTSSTANGVLAGSLYLYTDNNKATQIVHNGVSNAAFLSGGDAYIRGQVYVGGNGASTGTQLVYNSGTWGISISGNAATATNLIGLGSIQSTSTGTSYQNNYQVRENSGGGGNTNEIYAPQLAFHWSGVVASSIMMEASGRMAIRNNPGGSYENFIAAVVYSYGYGDSTQWNTAFGWGNHASAGYQPASTAITTSNIGSQSVSYADYTNRTSRGIIEDTRAAQRIPNDYDDYRVSWEFTDKITGIADWHTAMTMKGWHDGYAAWQIIGPSSTTAHENWYLRSGNTTVWNSLRRIWHNGDFTSTDVSNWNTAYNDRISSATVTGTTTKTLTLTQGDGGTVTASWTDYDTDNDAQQLTYNPGANQLSISNGNSIELTGLATEEFVTGQGYITGSYLPLSGGTLSGAVVVNLGNVSSDTVAFKVGGPGNYDSLTIGMEDTPDYDAFIASFGNDIRFYSGKGVATENHSFYWFTSKAGTAQHSVVAMQLDHNQNLTIGGTFTEQSSIRYKENVKSIPSVSQKVEKLDAVSYNKIGNKEEEIGLIAEDVAELFPEVVKYDNEGRPDGINYSRLSVILLKAVQELTERVNKLENK